MKWEKVDEEWADMERQARIHTKLKMHETARENLNALIQWDELERQVEIVTKWLVRR